MSTRRFRAAPGRTLVLPSGLTEGAGNARLKPGDVIEIEVGRIDGRIEQPNGNLYRFPGYRRYINNAVRLGDLIEETTPVAAPAALAKKE